jgi:hypothetical protein
MFMKLFREEPEVLALLAIVLMALFVRRPELPRVRWDLDAGLPSMERELPRVQFIPFRQ